MPKYHSNIFLHSVEDILKKDTWHYNKYKLNIKNNLIIKTV